MNSQANLSYSAKLILELLIYSDGVYSAGGGWMPSTTEAWSINDIKPHARDHANLDHKAIKEALNELVQDGWLHQLKNGRQKGQYRFTGTGATIRKNMRSKIKKTGIQHASFRDAYHKERELLKETELSLCAIKRVNASKQSEKPSHGHL